jgi:3-isopropylmalate/(R)-2-methylmalate dehydratase large subunit
MTQKILAAHARHGSIEPGQLIEADIDLVLGNDITAPVAIKEFEQAGFKKVWDPRRIALVMDHFVPAKDIASAEQCRKVEQFAARHDIEHFYHVGAMGIEHVLLPEKGLVAPAELIIGADSHTCTYGALGAFATGVGSTDMAAALATGKCWFKVPGAIKFEISGTLSKPWVSGKDVILQIIGQIGVDGALYQSMEFTGTGVKELTIDDRLCMANMAIEAGAKNGIFEVDEITTSFLADKVSRPWQTLKADDDADYSKVIQVNLDAIELTVACPHLPSHTRTVAALPDLAIHQVVIGSCTNGRLSDLRTAARILRGQKIKKGVRVIVIPGSQKVYREALAEGLIEILLEAGAAISTPTCGPCLGGHMGILAKGERAVATTNRNFVGRMGHAESEVYLSGPAVAAASALAGIICSPERI